MQIPEPTCCPIFYNAQLSQVSTRQDLEGSPAASQVGLPIPALPPGLQEMGPALTPQSVKFLVCVI